MEQARVAAVKHFLPDLDDLDGDTVNLGVIDRVRKSIRYGQLQKFSCASFEF